MIEWISLIDGPVAGALVGFGVWYFQSRIEALRTAQTRLHDERRALYTEILDPYIRLLIASKTGEVPQHVLEHMQSLEYRKASFQFALIAPDEVVQAHNDFLQFIYNAEARGGMEPKEMLNAWGGFLLVLRRHLGNPETDLRAVDMLRGWITDADRVLGSGPQ